MSRLHFKRMNSSGLAPNNVSRSIALTDTSFIGVVSQSGKPVLDSELNAAFEMLPKIDSPSGWVRKGKDASTDFLFPVDLGPNTILLKDKDAIVAGYKIKISRGESTKTFRVSLSEAPVYDGTLNGAKRHDFVYLEVWKALVTPGSVAKAFVNILDASQMADGNQVKVNGEVYTARLAPTIPNDFELVPGNNTQTANHLADAINANVQVGVTKARVITGGKVLLYPYHPAFGGIIAGALGNNSTLSIESGIGWTVSGPNFTGGVDGKNRPDGFRVYKHGNLDSADDVPDELLDETLLVETSQRIQLQYRIVVKDGVDFKTSPDGFSSGTVVAEAGYPYIPADGVSASGSSDAAAYGEIDSGLWIAGDGSEDAAQDLNSLDGFRYAIPIAFVFRHNNHSDAAAIVPGFDPVNNPNGAPHTDDVGTSSDRPDGAFCNFIAPHNIIDLRKHVGAFDLHAELKFQFQSLLDGETKTWAVDVADKFNSGQVGEIGVSPMICNEIGRTGTGAGPLVRKFDHVARRFGAQPVVERLVVAFWPGDREIGPTPSGNPRFSVNPGKFVTKAAGTVDWREDDKLVFDLANFNASSLGGVFSGDGLGGGDTTGTPHIANILDFAPLGTCISDVIQIWHDDGHSSVLIDQAVKMKTINGLGGSRVEIVLDENLTMVNGANSGNPDYSLVSNAGPSPRRIFVEFEITYPAGSGLTDTPIDGGLVPNHMMFPNGPILEHDVAQRPGDFKEFAPPKLRDGFREVKLEYIANETSTYITDDIVSVNQNVLYLPRRFSEIHMVQDHNATNNPVDDGGTTYGSSARKITLINPLPNPGHSVATVRYYAQDAIPNANNGYGVNFFYRSRAAQTAGSKGAGILLPSELVLEPLIVSDNVWSGQVGKGSADNAYPYASPLDQIPVADPSVFEWHLAASARIGVYDFETNTGLLTLHPYVQADGQGDLILQNPTLDAEFRTHFPVTEADAYQPTMIAQPLKGPARHKVMLPYLCKVKLDDVLFRAGEVVLVVLTRYADMDAENKIAFVGNESCAAVYRTKNLLLMGGNS